MHRLSFLVLLISSSMAHASEWVFVAQGEDGLRDYVDVSSIRIAAGIRRAWIKSIFVPHSKRGVADDSNKWQNYQVIRLAFDCGQELVRGESATVYYEDGTLWSDPTGQFLGSWQPVTPDTLYSAHMGFVCAWKPR
jgi:Surface-adhesin protein E